MELCNDFDSEFILQGIRTGFSLIDSNISIKDIQPVETENHPLVCDTQTKLLVDQQLQEEICDNNYEIAASKPVITSAIGAIPKKDGKVRIIHDCSLPEQGSLNSYATKDPCVYQTVSDAVSCIKPSWYMAKVDLQSAYRSVGIRPDEYCLTGIKWMFNNSDSYTYLLDRKLPFGARKSPPVFNRITQSVCRMMKRRGYTCVVLLDDFFVAAETFQECAEALRVLISLLRRLGFRINWKKVSDPTQDLVFLGVRINTASGYLSLDPAKVQEIIRTIDDILAKKRITKSQLQSFAGKLSWASTVTPWGRSFLNNTYGTLAKLKANSHKCILTDWLIKDFKWWRQALQKETHTKRIWDSRESVWLYSDASGNGGGVFCDGSWLYRNWQRDTGFANCHINIKELAMVYLAIHHWADQLTGLKVTVHVDSTAAESVINRQRAPNGHSKFIIKQLAILCIHHDIVLQAVHIPGSDNDFADVISRLDEPGQFERFISLLHLYYHPMSPPLLYWLPYHMSYHSLQYLSPQIHQWINRVNSNASWTMK